MTVTIVRAKVSPLTEEQSARRAFEEQVQAEIDAHEDVCRCGQLLPFRYYAHRAQGLSAADIFLGAECKIYGNPQPKSGSPE